MSRCHAPWCLVVVILLAGLGFVQGDCFANGPVMGGMAYSNPMPNFQTLATCSFILSSDQAGTALDITIHQLDILYGTPDSFRIYDGNTTDGELLFTSPDNSAFAAPVTMSLPSAQALFVVYLAPTHQRGADFINVSAVAVPQYTPLPNNTVYTAVLDGASTIVTNWLAGGQMALFLPSGIFTPANWIFSIRLKADAGNLVAVQMVILDCLLGYDTLTISDPGTGVVYNAYNEGTYFPMNGPVFSQSGVLYVNFTTSPRANRQFRGIRMIVMQVSDTRDLANAGLCHTETTITNPYYISNLVAGSSLQQYIRYSPNTYCALIVNTGESCASVQGSIFTELYEDTVSIYDGTTTSAPLVAVLSGQVPVTDTYPLTTGSFLIVFQTNNDSSFDGPGPKWGYNLYVIIPSSCGSPTAPTDVNYPFACSGVQTVRVTSTAVSTVTMGMPFASPGYSRNLECGYRFLAPLGFDVEMIVEANLGSGDCLDFYCGDSPGNPRLMLHTSVCGNASGILVMAPPASYVQFRSDGQLTGDGYGFTIKHLQVATNRLPCDPAGFPSLGPNAPFGPVKSPTPFAIYPPNMNCSWSINVGTPVFLRFLSGIVDIKPGDRLLIEDRAAGRVLYDSDSVDASLTTLIPCNTTGPIVLIFTSDFTPLLSNGWGFAIFYVPWVPTLLNCPTVTETLPLAGLWTINPLPNGNLPIATGSALSCAWKTSGSAYAFMPSLIWASTISLPPGATLTLSDATGIIATYGGIATDLALPHIYNCANPAVFTLVVPANALLSNGDQLYTGVDIELQGHTNGDGSCAQAAIFECTPGSLGNLNMQFCNTMVAGVYTINATTVGTISLTNLLYVLDGAVILIQSSLTNISLYMPALREFAGTLSVDRRAVSIQAPLVAHWFSLQMMYSGQIQVSSITITLPLVETMYSITIVGGAQQVALNLPLLVYAANVELSNCPFNFPRLASARSITGDVPPDVNPQLPSLKYLSGNFQMMGPINVSLPNLLSVGMVQILPVESFVGCSVFSAPMLREIDSLNLLDVCTVDVPRLKSASSISVSGPVLHLVFPLLQMLASPLSFGSICIGTAVSSMTTLLDLSAPMLRWGNIEVSHAPQVRILDVPALTVGGLSVLQGGSTLQSVNLTSMVKGTILLGNSMYLFRELNMPQLETLMGPSGLIIGADGSPSDISTVYAPKLRVASTIVLVGLTTTRLEFPALQIVTNYLSVVGMPALEAVSMPRLEYVGAGIILENTGIQTMSFPALTSVASPSPYSFVVTYNTMLTSVLLCAMQVSAGGVEATYNPSLSCASMQNAMTALSISPLQMDPEYDCDLQSSIAFSCAGSVESPITFDAGCGFSVSCLQYAINNGTSGVLNVPAGTYTGCASPLNFYGRALTLIGEGMATTVIDCEGVGRAFEASGTSTGLVANLAVKNGRVMQGSGCFHLDVSINFANVTFSNCSSVEGDGGAVLVTGATAAPSFDGCVFIANQAISGAGGAVAFDGALSGSFTGCLFQANKANDEGGAISFQSGASLFSSLSLSNCNLAYNLAARGGAVYSDAALGVTGGTMSRNAAVQYGGAIAVVPDLASGAMLTLSNVDIIANVAGQGAGVFVYSASVDMSASNIISNTASLSGGGMSVACSGTYKTLRGIQGPCGITFTARDSMFSKNRVTGGNGGGLLLLDVSADLQGTNFTSNAVGTSGSGGGVYASDTALKLRGCALTQNQAAQTAGGLYCEARAPCDVDATTSIKANSAGAAGGGIFYCLSGCLDVATPLPPSFVAVSMSGNLVGSGGYGAATATDAYLLTWTTPPQALITSGNVLSGASDGALRLQITDFYGSPVSGAVNVLQLSVAAAAGEGAARLDGTTTVLASAGMVGFQGTRATALTPSDTGHTFTITCRHVSIGSIVAAANVTLSTCPDGQGVTADAPGGGADAGGGSEEAPWVTQGLLCAPCAPGTAAAGEATNYTCRPCEPGSFSGAGASACQPCAVNTFQALPGGAACAECPAGRHTGGRAGAVACDGEGADAIVVNGGAGLSGSLVGIIVGALVLFLCLIVLLVYVVFRYSRKKTMEKYYLDEDATVRLGVTDSALALAVRKFITATSTSRIGNGQFTDIYKGKYEGRWIALKVVKGESVGHSVALSEFRREVIALSILKIHHHPAIVEMPFYLDRSPVCIGLKYCKAGSLKRAMVGRGLKLSVEDKVRMMAQVASGLALMHSVNIAHMDMKTDNLLLSDDKKSLKIADFGICRLLTADSTPSNDSKNTTPTGRPTSTTSLSMAGGTREVSVASEAAVRAAGEMVALSEVWTNTGDAFTPQYVDPYLLVNPKESSPDALRRADVFSFGVVMWALWAMEEPFAGVDAGALVERRTEKPDLRPPNFDSCHVCYQTVMERAWCTTPSLRLTMGACLEELCRCLSTHFEAQLSRDYLNIPALHAAATASDGTLDSALISTGNLATNAPFGMPTSGNHIQLDTLPPQSASGGGTGFGLGSQSSLATGGYHTGLPRSSTAAAASMAVPPGGAMFLQTARGDRTSAALGTAPLPGDEADTALLATRM